MFSAQYVLGRNVSNCTLLWILDHYVNIFILWIELSKDGREILHEIVSMLSNGLDREERDNLVQFYKPFQSPLISSIEHETGTHT